MGSSNSVFRKTPQLIKPGGLLTKGKELKDIPFKTETKCEANFYGPLIERAEMESLSNRQARMLLPKNVPEEFFPIGKELKDIIFKTGERLKLIFVKTDTKFKANNYRPLYKGVKMESFSTRLGVMLLPKNVPEEFFAIGERLKLIFVKTDTKFKANNYRPLYEGVKMESFSTRLAVMLLPKNVPEEFFAIGKRLKLIFVKTDVVEQKMLKSGAMPDNTGIGGGILFVLYCISTDD